MKYVGKVASMVLLAALLAGCSSTPDNDSGLTSEVNVEGVLQSANKVHRQWRNTLVDADGVETICAGKVCHDDGELATSR